MVQIQRKLPKPKSIEKIVEEQIGKEGRVTQIGSLLNIGQKGEMECFLKDNSSIFAWLTAKMSRISPSMISHSFNVNPMARPVKQKMRKFIPDREEAVKQETDKILKTRFIREVHYPNWLSNVVMVKNANGK